MRELEHVLREAAGAGIIVLSTAPDKDTNSFVGYARLLFGTYRTRQERHEADFDFPEAEDLIGTTISSQPQGTEVKSPNTLTAAVAVGVTAVVLYSIQAGYAENPQIRTVPPNDLRRIFRHMSSRDEQGTCASSGNFSKMSICVLKQLKNYYPCWIELMCSE